MVETRSQKKKSNTNIENTIIKKRKRIKDISDSESDNDSDYDSEIDEDGNLKDFIDDSDLKKKVKKIILEVNVENDAAKRFYIVNEFKNCGVRKDYYFSESGRKDAQLMELKITE